MVLSLEQRARAYFDELPEEEKEIWSFETLLAAFVEEEQAESTTSLSRRIQRNTAATQTAIFETIREILKTPEFKPKFRKQTKKGISLVAMLSDWHLGKKVQGPQGEVIYNAQIAEERLNKVFENLIRQIEIKQTYSVVDEVVLVLIGDHVDGDTIYPTQAYHLDIQVPEQLLQFSRVTLKLIKTLSNLVPSIRVFGTKGNHGRATRYGSEQSNYDLALYTMLKFFVDELKTLGHLKNVDVEYNKYADFVNFKVRDWNFHATHIAPKTPGNKSADRDLLGLKDIHECDVILFGHWHHCGMHDVTEKLRVFRNAAITGQDDLSNRLAVSSTTGQLLITVTEEDKGSELILLKTN